MKQSILQDRDGFHVREDEFTWPEDAWKLDPQTKRAVTICDLFVNHQYGISDIARALDEDHENVVRTLLQEGIIRERRVKQTTRPHETERRKSVRRSQK